MAGIKLANIAYKRKKNNIHYKMTIHLSCYLTLERRRREANNSEYILPRSTKHHLRIAALPSDHAPTQRHSFIKCKSCRIIFVAYLISRSLSSLVGDYFTDVCLTILGPSQCVLLSLSKSSKVQISCELFINLFYKMCPTK